MQGDMSMADLCGLVIVVMVLGEEVNASDAVRQILLKVLSIHAGPHAAQVPISYIACILSEHGTTYPWKKAYYTHVSMIV